MKKSNTKPFNLEIDVKSAVPIYEQIKSAVRIAVFGKQLAEGDQIVSIRELSTRHSINPITIMKAYSQLETEGLLQSRRGTGYFVQPPPKSGNGKRKKLLNREVSTFLNKMMTIGFSAADIVAEIQTVSGGIS